MHAGDDMFPRTPEFPDAATVATPWLRSVVMRLVVTGLTPSQFAGNRPPPRLRLIASRVATTGSWVVRRALSQSRAAPMSLSYAMRHAVVMPPQIVGLVPLENTLTAMIDAAGAAPLSELGLETGPPLAMPATWVPCSHPGTPTHGVAAPLPKSTCCPPAQRLSTFTDALEKHASAMTEPFRYGWSTWTPVSRTAIVRPEPS